MKRKSSGFTIVELLIVIVIIGILAAITIATYSGIQSRARDTQRKSDIAQLTKAIESYYAVNGDYPFYAGWCTQISNPSYSAAFKAELQPYMSKIPYDPLYAVTSQDYFYRNVNDQSYNLYAELEESDKSDDGFAGCTRIGGIDNEYDLRYPPF
jgi:type II secretion system protein G